MPTVPPKPFISTNFTPKTGLSSVANSHLNNQNKMNKDLMDIPNQKMHVNHVKMAMPIETKETFKTVKLTKDIPKPNDYSVLTNEFKEDKETNKNDRISPKPELIFNNDTCDKDQTKSTDKNSKQISTNTKRKVDGIKNNSTAFSVR